MRRLTIILCLFASGCGRTDPGWSDAEWDRIHAQNAERRKKAAEDSARRLVEQKGYGETMRKLAALPPPDDFQIGDRVDINAFYEVRCATVLAIADGLYTVRYDRLVDNRYQTFTHQFVRRELSHERRDVSVPSLDGKRWETVAVYVKNLPPEKQ